MAEEEAEILRRSRRLADPTNYRPEKMDESPICPENILLFARHEAKQLIEPSPTQHHRHVLIVNLKARGKMVVETQMHPLAEGECLLVFPFQTHCYIELSAPIVEWLFISFECRLDPRLDVLRDRGALRLNQSGRTHVRNLLRDWVSPDRRETLPLHLGLWLHEMVKSRRPKSAPSETRVADSEAHLVEAVNRLVYSRRERSLSIQELAVSLGVSGSSLRSRFRVATGRSIGRHVREIRLNFSCELLYDTRLRIEEISGRCGYESLFAFSRAFRNAHGCSPSQYRKRWVTRG